jgi:NAD(P)-dependent dehydrogenase (short-subunit alcohol dehydrogenase family)
MLVNCVGAMRVTQAMLPRLRAGTGRKIVNITSSLGSIALTGGPMGGGYYAYRMGKAALNMFTRTLAAELKGEGFTCFAMHPGWVRTRMGGEHAPLSVEQSVGGMIPVIEEAGAELNGAFMDYRGREMEW